MLGTGMQDFFFFFLVILMGRESRKQNEKKQQKTNQPQQQYRDKAKNSYLFSKPRVVFSPRDLEPGAGLWWRLLYCLEAIPLHGEEY